MERKNRMTNKLLIFTLLALLAVVPASASTFLTFTQLGGTVGTFNVTNSGTGNMVYAYTVPVSYQVLVPNGLGMGLRTTGFLSFQAVSTTTASNLGSGSFSETGFNTGYIYICDTLAAGGCSPGSYAFAANYGPSATVAGNGASGSLGDANTISDLAEVIYFSPYLLFTPGTGDAFSLSSSGGTPAWAIGAGGFLAAEASGGIVGTFSADITPSSASPEPATMALLGSALIGLGIIGRKRFSR
jgi:hypothetical protein